MVAVLDRSLDPAGCLDATAAIDARSSTIVATVEALGLTALVPAERARRVFRFARDRLQYRFQAPRDPGQYVASRILDAGGGFCVQKAIVACALGRTAGIPTALVLCDMRDHTLAPRIVQALGTDVMFHHGLNAFHVDGEWRLADASLSPDLIERKRYRQNEFDGETDALLPPDTLDGQRHAEYLRFHGIYADLPFDQMLGAFVAGYARADLRLLADMGLST